METTLVLVLVVLLLLGRSSYCYSPCPTGLGLNSTNPTLVPTVLVVVVEVLVIMLSVVGVVVVEVVDVLVLVALVVSSLLLPPLPSSGPLSCALHLDLSNATATVSAPPRPPRSSRGSISMRRGCPGGRPPVCHTLERFLLLRVVVAGSRSRSHHRGRRHAGRCSPASDP